MLVTAVHGMEKIRRLLVILGCIFFVLLFIIFYNQTAWFHTIVKVNYSYVFEKCSSINISEYAVLSRQSQNIAKEMERLNDENSGLKARKDVLDSMTVELEARLSVMASLSGSVELDRQKLIRLGERLQAQIERLQNPIDCSAAEFVVTHHRDCGFGCQLHHLSYAFSIALAMNRTFYVRPVRGQIWKNLFYPLTKCNLPVKEHIYLQTINATPQNRFHPPTLPEEWASALEGMHGAPYAWFHGHLIRYLLRLKPSKFRLHLEESVLSLRSGGRPHDQYFNPVVGIHVRRTDKLIHEAQRFEVSAYMKPTERFFQQKLIEYQLKNHTNEKAAWFTNRTVFLASDEPSVFVEARQQYKNYHFIGEETRATRSFGYLLQALEGIIYDLILLSSSDYLVCTFSSNVCRAAYELMMTNNDWYGDRSGHVQSLDDIYHTVNPLDRPWRVIADYPKGHLHKGDIVNVKRNLWNGYVYVNEKGEYPAYLFEELPLHPSDDRPLDQSRETFKHL